MTAFRHVPIMIEETLALLGPERGGAFVDGTLGGGGHAEAVLERLPAGGILYGIDRDGEAIAAATERLKRFGNGFCAIRGNFFHLKELLEERGVRGVNGILFDLGVSSYQLDAAERGFSYNADAMLDMRMDLAASLSAYDVVNGYDQNELFRIIRAYGEERYAGRIAGAIVKARAQRPIERTGELAELIRNAMPAAARREAQHPAKRTFQAIRIEVNGELEGLDRALASAHDLLLPGGVLAVITFHSLEDRIVKHAFRAFEQPCTCDPHAPVCICGKTPTARVLTKKPLSAGAAEVEENPRARSAKLRAIERI